MYIYNNARHRVCFPNTSSVLRYKVKLVHHVAVVNCLHSSMLLEFLYV